MTANTPEQIAKGLHRDARDLVLECPQDWFVAADLTWARPGPTGHALMRLSARGLLERASDRGRGRSKYSLTPLGLAVRHLLEQEPK